MQHPLHLTTSWQDGTHTQWTHCGSHPHGHYSLVTPPEGRPRGHTPSGSYLCDDVEVSLAKAQTAAVIITLSSQLSEEDGGSIVVSLLQWIEGGGCNASSGGGPVSTSHSLSAPGDQLQNSSHLVLQRLNQNGQVLAPAMWQ